MAPYSSSSVIQVSGSPEIPILFKLLFTPNSEGVLSNALSLEATVKILALNNRVFKTVFTHQFRIFRLLETMPDELYRAISYYFYILKNVPHLLQLLRMLQRYFAAKLQKCFLNYRTSRDFPLGWGWIDIDSLGILMETQTDLQSGEALVV